MLNIYSHKNLYTYVYIYTYKNTYTYENLHFFSIPILNQWEVHGIIQEMMLGQLTCHLEKHRLNICILYMSQTTKNKTSKWKSQKQKYKSPRRKHKVLKNNLNSADSFSKYTKLQTQKKLINWITVLKKSWFF